MNLSKLNNQESDDTCVSDSDSNDSKVSYNKYELILTTLIWSQLLISFNYNVYSCNIARSESMKRCVIFGACNPMIDMTARVSIDFLRRYNLVANDAILGDQFNRIM